MRIQASTAKRGAGHIGDDNGVGRLILSEPNSEQEREFLTSVYRIVAADSREDQDKGVAWMREYLKSFPPFED